MAQAAINAQSQRGQGGVSPFFPLPPPPLTGEVLSSLPGTGEFIVSGMRLVAAVSRSSLINVIFAVC